MAALTGRLLKISVGGTSYETEVFSASVEADDADSDKITFAEAAAGGGRKYTIKMEILQDLVTSSLWNQIWTVAGTDVVVLLKPYGNTAASTSQPHYSMTATVKEPNGTLIGGEANSDVLNRLTVEVEWPLGAKPTKVTT